MELNIERSKFQFVKFLSLSFTIIIIHEEARYTFDETRSMESTKAVTRFDNQRYIFNQECFIVRYRSRSRWKTHLWTYHLQRGEIQTFGIPVSTASNAAAIPCNLRRFRTSQSKLNVIRTKLTFRPRINERAQ